MDLDAVAQASHCRAGGSETLSEWKSKSVMDGLTDNGRTGVVAKDACAYKNAHLYLNDDDD